METVVDCSVVFTFIRKTKSRNASVTVLVAGCVS
jgi:hypothetical protein